MKTSGVSYKSIFCDRTVKVVFEVNAQFALREIFKMTDRMSMTWSLRPKYLDRVLALVGDSTMTSDLAIDRDENHELFTSTISHREKMCWCTIRCSSGDTAAPVSAL